jgi:hypothetical protein
MSSIDEMIIHLYGCESRPAGHCGDEEALDRIGEIRDRCEALGVNDVVQRMEALREGVEVLERHLMAGWTWARS